jgi:hypothetical protein
MLIFMTSSTTPLNSTLCRWHNHQFLVSRNSNAQKLLTTLEIQVQLDYDCPNQRYPWYAANGVEVRKYNGSNHE